MSLRLNLNKIPMKKLALCFLIFGVSISCTKTQKVEKNLETVVSGEMLFSGPNSLQAPLAITANSLSEEFGTFSSTLRSIGISGVQISLAENQAEITESLLLQIVSDNNKMMALGTLSPLESGTSFDLSVAEEIDILPFIKDEGATWVLDVNLSEDVMEEMTASVSLQLTINYTN